MKNIKLLEKRVQQAVRRLNQLSDERPRLEEELRTLRRQLEEATAAGSDDGEERKWEEQRARTATVIREALSELRAD